MDVETHTRTAYGVQCWEGTGTEGSQSLFPPCQDAESPFPGVDSSACQPVGVDVWITIGVWKAMVTAATEQSSTTAIGALFLDDAGVAAV